jgi:hypothetical protein
MHRSIAVLTLLAATAAAQEPAPATSVRSGARPVLARAEEIALARSAAPETVSDSATIWVLHDTSYVVAVRGSASGAACYVSRSWKHSLEPHCFDAEGAATIMRMHMRETELLHRGVSHEDAQRAVASEIAKGALRLPQRPAMSYMMSAAQVLYGDDGRLAGRWQPHLMIYYPFLRSADIGMRAPDIRAAIVTDEGHADASIMIVARDFISPRR